jgi:hypothetical protein
MLPLLDSLRLKGIPLYIYLTCLNTGPIKFFHESYRQWKLLIKYARKIFPVKKGGGDLDYSHERKSRNFELH